MNVGDKVRPLGTAPDDFMAWPGPLDVIGVVVEMNEEGIENILVEFPFDAEYLHDGNGYEESPHPPRCWWFTEMDLEVVE